MKRYLEAGKMARNFSLCAIVVLMAAGSAYAKNMFEWRLVTLPSLGFKNAAQVQTASDYMARMKASGYNGLILGGGSITHLPKQPPEAKARIQQFVATAGHNGISIIPLSQGPDGNPFMDSTLVEAFPCKATAFAVANGEARAKGDPSLAFANGGFEEDFSPWQLDRNYFSIDSTVMRSGGASLRCDDPTANYVRANQNIKVKPYTAYRLSMWVKTQNIATHNNKYGDWKCRDIAFTVQGGGVYIYSDRYFKNGLSANTNWKLVQTHFHSLGNTSVKVSVQATRGHQYKGTVWYDDIAISEVGLCGAVIRENMEVVVKSTAGKVFSEGSDYAIGEEKLTIPAGSSIKNGDKLLVDWYRMANVVSSRSNAAFCYQDIWAGMRKQIALEDEWFGVSSAKMMKYSEWRLAGWDPVCIQSYDINNIGSAGYTSAVANITNRLYKEANGSRIGLVYNDAYDPYHNSKAAYYVVNGGCAGSGYGLDEDIIVVNWCGSQHNRYKSLRFFAGTDGVSRPGWGVKTSRQRQILSTALGIPSWQQWMAQLDLAEEDGNLPDGSVIGITYHTYKAFPQYYDQIEHMAAVCDSAGRWGSGPIPFPKATPGVPYDVTGVKREGSQIVIGDIALTTGNGVGSKHRLLRFSIPDNKNVKLSIYDLQGKRVAILLDEQMAPNTYVRNLNVSNFAAGVYFASLEVKEKGVKRITLKLMVY